MDREEKIVIKDQTFTDIAVNELADVKARLMVYHYYHQDKEAEKLPMFQKLETCYEQMNEYDRMRVDTRAARLFATYMVDPDPFLPYKVLKRKYFKIWLICTLITIILLSLIIHPPFPPQFLPNDTSPVYGYDIEQMVHETILELQPLLYDIDHNGRLTCLDRAVEFKHLWDRKYPGIPCLMIQNWENPFGFNHYFVKINGIYYDPWSETYPKGMHDMWSVWGKSGQYDPRYNRENYYWYDKVSKYRRW